MPRTPRHHAQRRASLDGVLPLLLRLLCSPRTFVLDDDTCPRTGLQQELQAREAHLAAREAAAAANAAEAATAKAEAAQHKKQLEADWAAHELEVARLGERRAQQEELQLELQRKAEALAALNTCVRLCA